MMRSILVILTAALALSGCGDKAAPPTETPDAEAPSLPPVEPDVAKTGPLHFRDVTRDAGITFRVKAGSRDKMWIPETIGQGVMLFDYDSDGDLDLYFANGGDMRDEKKLGRYKNALYRNDGDWKFTDVTEGSGLECPEWSAGVYHCDVDADGHDDVYVTQLGENRFFRNVDGTGRFEPKPEWGGAAGGYSTSAAFFDAEGDGDLDLYICQYVEFDPKNPPNQGLPCEWKNLAVCCGPRGLVPAKDVFFRNENGRFVDRTEESGFVVKSARGEAVGAYSLGVVTGDYDLDGDTDVFVAVDSRPNLTYENLGGGNFREVAEHWQTAVNADAIEQAGMGVAAGDADGDGWIDLFITHFSHDTNTLYLNAARDENVFFDDVTRRAGLGGAASYSFLSWGVGFEDFNCDGLLDIYIASGHVYPQAEGVVDLGTSYAQQNQLFIGTGKLKWQDRASDSGPAMLKKQVSRGASFGDLDRDGRVDLVVVNMDDWPNLIRNECDVKGRWFGLELIDTNPANRHAVGAHVTLELEDGSRVVREVHGGGGYMGANDQALHFSYGTRDTAKKLTVRWPDGTTTRLKPPAQDSWYELTKGQDELRRD